MSEQTLELVSALRRRLHATIRRLTLAELAAGALLTLGVLAGAWLLSVAIEARFWLDVGPRSVLFWCLLTAAVILTGRLLIVPVLRLAGTLRPPAEEEVAARIGRRFPDVSDRLVNLLDLVEGHRSIAPSGLVDGAVRMLGEQVERVPFEQVEDFGRARHLARWVALPVLGLLVFAGAAPSTFLQASGRLLSPGVAFQRPGPFQLTVAPGTVELVRGQTLDIEVRAGGSQRPRVVVLTLNNLGEERTEEVRLTADAAGVFRHRIANVRQSLRYRASADAVETAWYRATVTERPLVRGLQLSLDFPAYARIPSQRLEPNVGDVAALPGTRVSVEVGVGGRDLRRALLRFDDGTTQALDLDGPTASGSFVLRRAATYQVVVENRQGIANADPITYSLSLVADEAPAIVMLDPAPASDLTESMRAGLRARISDDFGFSSMKLFYRLAESRFGTVQEQWSTLPVTIGSLGQLDQEVLYDWLLTQQTTLDPVPGDVIEYFLQVWDNDAVSGFKPARSATQRLRVPSLSEQYEQLAGEQESTQSGLEDLVEEARRVRDDFRDLKNDLRSKPEADWEDRRQIDQLQQRQQNIEERVDDLTRQLESMTELMQENNLVSEQTLQTYQELQRVMEEINSPELQEALKQLQDALEHLNLPQMQQAIQQFEFNEEQFRQRLERTLELFERLHLQQDLDEAARRAEELARQEERLARETERLLRDQQNPGGNPEQQQSTETSESLAREQERIREEMQRLQEKIDELRRRSGEVKGGPQRPMQQLSRDLQERNLPQQMQENSRQLRNDQLQQARQGQQSLQQQLDQLQQALRQMQSAMQQSGMQLNLSGLRRSLEDVLTLSRQQEELAGTVQGLAANSPQLRTTTQRQVVLSEDLSRVADSLRTISRQLPQMNREVQRQVGEALREMSAATEALTNGAAGQAGGHQKGAMTHLNDLAVLLSNLLDQMMNAGGSGGGMSMEQMLQQMQQMSGQQQQLNDQIQQLLNDAQGNRLTLDTQARLRQLAEQQEAIRRQLKQLGRDPGARGRLLGDLERIAEQMEETIQELQRGRGDRRMIERQRQILTRMLDAQRSLRERGEERRRQARSGEDHSRTSPANLTPSERADKLRRDLLRALESGYAPDYQELIKRYFELLQQQSQPAP